MSVALGVLLASAGCREPLLGCGAPAPHFETDPRTWPQDGGSTALDGTGSTSRASRRGRQADVWATPDVQQRSGNFPPVQGAFVIGNQTGQSRVVRIRPLKPTVQLDCSGISGAPHLALRPVHFAPAQSWLVESGRAVPLRAAPGRACTAALVDATGVPRRLVFWSHSAWPEQSLPSVTHQLDAGAGAQRHLAIVAEEGEAVWSTHSALKPNLGLVDPKPPEGCALSDEELSWDPMIAGSHTLVEVLTAPDGCSALDLLTDAGMQRIYVCLPPGMLPLVGGEDLYVAELDTGHNVLPLAGVEMLADKAHLRFGRGSDAVYFGQGELTVGAANGCPGQHDSCGSYARALRLTVTLPGAKPAHLGPGDTLKLPGGGTFAVVQAVDRLVWDTACATGGARHIETVWSKP